MCCLEMLDGSVYHFDPGITIVSVEYMALYAPIRRRDDAVTESIGAIDSTHVNHPFCGPFFADGQHFIGVLRRFRHCAQNTSRSTPCAAKRS